MARFCSLFSSSSANSTYIGTPSDGILIDAGASAKQLTLACEQENIDLRSLRAIFVTHEHSDHVKGLRVLADKLKIPVISTEETLLELQSKSYVSEKTDCRVIEKKGITVGDMEIIPFDTPHDSVHSVGFRVNMPDARVISVCTDIGTVTEEIFSSIKGSDLILIESNHDINMLKNGPYPYDLKMRILSKTGHLPNTECAETAAKLLENGTTRFVLGHLSRQNNTPETAFSETKNAFDNKNARNNIDYQLFVAGDRNKMIKL